MRLSRALPVAALAGAGVATVVLALLPGSQDDGVMPAASPRGSSLAASELHEPPAVTLPVSRVVAGGGASRSGPAGVPVGFARSADGAVSAATAWLAATEGSAGLDPRRRPALLAAIGDSAFVSDATARLTDRAATLNLLPDGRPSNDGVLVDVVWPTRGAFRVVSASIDAAKVEIWYLYQLGLTAPGGALPNGTWRRVVVTLRWNSSGDWCVAGGFEFREGPNAGVPVPSEMDRANLLAPLGTGWQLYKNTQE